MRRGHVTVDDKRTACGRPVAGLSVAATWEEFDRWWEWGEACRTCDRIVNPPNRETEGTP